MRTTQEYFDMPKEELQEIRNEYGYTREECKLFDESENTIIFGSLEDLNGQKGWYSDRYEVGEALAMTDGRFVLLLF